MAGFFQMIEVIFLCITFLFVAFIVVAHLPNSPLKTVLTQVCGWATAALCGALVLSPIDPIPDVFFPVGFIDDIVAVIVGYQAAKAAWNAGNTVPPAKAAA